MKLIGVDVGGTFTDLVLVETETGESTVHKVPTTPHDPSEGVLTVFCVLNQLGSALGFLAFIAANMAPLLAVPRAYIFGAVALLEAPLVLLRDTSHPAFEAAMAFGNAASLLAIGTVVWGALFAPATPHATAHQHLWTEHVLLADLDGMGLMFGVTLIMYSCHLEAVSIEADMARRQSFDLVMGLVFAALVVLFVAFGSVVYLALGEATGRVFVPTNASEVILEWRSHTPFLPSFF